MLESPASSSFLKTCLRNMESPDTLDRLLALKDFTVALRVATTRGGTGGGQFRGVTAATYMLERGLLALLADELKVAAQADCVVLIDTASHPRYMVQCKHGRQVAMKLNRACVAIQALFHVAQDTRLLRYLLRERPDIPDILKHLYEVAEQPGLPEGLTVRLLVVRLQMSLTCYSEKFGNQLGQDSKFVSRIISFALEQFEQTELFESHFFLVSNLTSKLQPSDVWPKIVELLAKIVLESKNKAHIVLICRLALAFRVCWDSTGKKLPESAYFRSAVLALAICEAESLAGAPFARQFGIELSYLYWANDEDIFDRLQHKPQELGFWTKVPKFVNRLKQLAQASYPLSTARAKEFEAIFLDTPQHAFSTLAPAGNEDILEKLEFLGFKKVERKALRKCSLVDCGRVQRVVGQFKVCSKCKLVAYCGPACQKLDWKAGHRKVCRL